MIYNANGSWMILTLSNKRNLQLNGNYFLGESQSEMYGSNHIVAGKYERNLLRRLDLLLKVQTISFNIRQRCLTINTKPNTIQCINLLNEKFEA